MDTLYVYSWPICSTGDHSRMNSLSTSARGRKRGTSTAGGGGTKYGLSLRKMLYTYSQFRSFFNSTNEKNLCLNGRNLAPHTLTNWLQFASSYGALSPIQPAVPICYGPLVEKINSFRSIFLSQSPKSVLQKEHGESFALKPDLDLTSRQQTSARGLWPARNSLSPLSSLDLLHLIIHNAASISQKCVCTFTLCALHYQYVNVNNNFCCWRRAPRPCSTCVVKVAAATHKMITAASL